VFQKVPTLYSASTLGDDNDNPAVYGQIHPFIVNEGEVIQLVVNNLDAAIHPFHLHGHQFQLLDRPRSDTGSWQGHGTGRGTPPGRKDVVAVNANSHAILRFKINHAGVFLFHCHIEWHVEMGLTATMIQIPEKLRNLPIPQDHLDVCKAMGIPTSGNAGGNTDPFDTTGFNTVHSVNYTGALFIPPPARYRPRGVRSIAGMY